MPQLVDDKIYVFYFFYMSDIVQLIVKFVGLHCKVKASGIMMDFFHPCQKVGHIPAKALDSIAIKNLNI